MLNAKCPLCGCKGIHACMGKSKISSKIIESKYNNFADAIKHIIDEENKKHK